MNIQNIFIQTLLYLEIWRIYFSFNEEFITYKIITNDILKYAEGKYSDSQFILNNEQIKISAHFFYAFDLIVSKDGILM